MRNQNLIKFVSSPCSCCACLSFFISLCVSFDKSDDYDNAINYIS